MEYNNPKNYSKKSLWKWILLYVVIAVVAYGLIYYFFFANKGGYTYNPQQYQTQNNTQSGTPTIKSDQDLTSASQALDATDVNQIDSGLNQNTADANSFAPRIRNKNGTSTNWSGYAVETDLTNPQNNAVSDVKGSWIVPTLDCTNATSNTYSSAWVGIDGYSDNSVEQIGTEQDCINGKPSYYAWYEMYPKPSFKIKVPVNAGDNISAEVQYAGNNKFILAITNNTANKTFTTTQKAKAQRQSAEWIMEAPWSGGVLPLADFGTIQFSNSYATINGHTGTISDSVWQNDPITMQNSSGSPKATPSTLSGDGSSFSVLWNSSN